MQHTSPPTNEFAPGVAADPQRILIKNNGGLQFSKKSEIAAMIIQYS
jgi:hypothetical protein